LLQHPQQRALLSTIGKFGYVALAFSRGGYHSLSVMTVFDITVLNNTRALNHFLARLPLTIKPVPTSHHRCLSRSQHQASMIHFSHASAVHDPDSKLEPRRMTAMVSTDLQRPMSESAETRSTEVLEVQTWIGYSLLLSQTHDCEKTAALRSVIQCQLVGVHKGD
jgi:hypothetical protein